MADNLFKWNFEKNEENFIYDTLKKLAESLKLESDGIFVPIVTIGDLSDNSRTYAFHIGVPELSGFTWRIFEINTKNSTRFSEIIFPSSIKGAKSFKISSKENLIETLRDYKLWLTPNLSKFSKEATPFYTGFFRPGNQNRFNDFLNNNSERLNRLFLYNYNFS